MKTRLFALLLLVLLIPLSAYAVDTVYVHSDVSPGEGAINTAVQAAITAGTLSNTVFKLDPWGYYILSGTVTVPPNQHLTIVAPQPGTTQATAPPQIFLSSQITTWRYTFDVFGDLTMKNVWLVYATTVGAQQSASMDIDEDTLRHTNSIDFENVIFDYAPINGSVEIRCTNLTASFENCYWRNNIDPHYRYYGRMISYPYQSTTWHTNKISFVNCTAANMGYGYMGYFSAEDTPETADTVLFNHCTFLNTMMHSIEPSFWQYVSVTNCLFVNTYMYGDILAEGSGVPNPAGGTIKIDSLANARPSAFPKFLLNETERHILFTHSAYYNEQWIRDFQDHGNTYSDTASARYKPNTQPLLSWKTLIFFDSVDANTGAKVWPFVNKSNLYENENPSFILAPTNQQSIKDFLLGRWLTGANVDWAYDIQSDLQGTWPMNEDLSYDNTTLTTAGMGGFPLGDIYRWWPGQYAAWKAQEASENLTINNRLMNGLTTGIVTVQPGIPSKYALTQNYPNPFNPSTQISYSVPKAGYVSLKVYNLLGEEMTTLFSGVQSPGNYSLTFDASGFSSGVYFYTLQAGSNSISKKMILMK